jgi:acetylornithine deacetylase/succinyl-diaminopimelate desuccinylase-like protein
MSMHKKIALLALALALNWGANAAESARSVHDQKAREIYAKVISIPTELGRNKVPEMAEYLAAEFRAAGFPDKDISILRFKGTQDATASLVVRYRGNGKSNKKPIVLLAHMDVVTAKREDWERDPYTLIEENGYFFGRGTADDKQGVVAITSALLRLKAEKFVPNRDLIAYFSGDEETAQATAIDTVKNHRELIDAEYALNADAGGGTLDEKSGKPLFFALQTAEKTYTDWTLTARNPGGHSSQPRDDNAIYELSAALLRLRQEQPPVMWNDTTRAALAMAGKQLPGELGDALKRFAVNPEDAEAAAIISKSPSYVGQIRTTCVATTLAGGHATNALPQTASANVNCRVFPGVKIADVGEWLRKVVGDGISVKLEGDTLSSDLSPLRPDVMAAVKRAVQAIHPEAPVVPAQTSGATDGLVFRAAGIPTYGVDGNFSKPGDRFAHGLNERLPVQSFYDSLTFWNVLLKELAGKR